MAAYESESVVQLAPVSKKVAPTGVDQLDSAGQTILQLLNRAANVAEQNSKGRRTRRSRSSQSKINACLCIRYINLPRGVGRSATHANTIGNAPPPMAHDSRLDANLLGDRPRTAPGRPQKHDPRSFQIALYRHRRPAATLQHITFLARKPDCSCFGNHPDLESRLTVL